jgi:hypothetical protein
VRTKIEDETGLLVPIEMFRGIDKRVASKVGKHESLVSHVLRGERKSPEVIEAMRYELTVIRDYLNRTAGKSNGT